MYNMVAAILQGKGRNMKLQKVYLRNITVFTGLELGLSEGINIIIGENGSGKTNFLKVLYYTCHDKGWNMLGSEYVRKYDFGNPYIPNIVIEYEKNDGTEETCWLQENGRKPCDRDGSEVLYIPAMEMLSHAKGLVSLYQKYDLPFERVQIDIIQNAELPETRNPSEIESRLLNIIGNVIKGEVIYEDGAFFVKKADGIKVGFEMEAEGFRKFALLWKLVRNGLLKAGSLLIWDEPEANMNPELLPVLADVLIELQRNGIQIIMATHSYNLSKYFELKKEESDQVLFHSFQRKENEVNVSSGDVFGSLISNKLIEADEKLLDLAYDKGVAD